MSHTTHSSALRPLAVVGLLAVAALAAPEASHAQTSSEAAFLNRLAPTVFLPTVFAFGSGALIPVPPGVVSGERALLARSPIHGHNPEPVPEDVAPESVNGAYALLGRSRP